LIFAFRNHKNSQENQERQDLAHCRPFDTLTMRRPSNQVRSITFGLKNNNLFFFFLLVLPYVAYLLRLLRKLSSTRVVLMLTKNHYNCFIIIKNIKAAAELLSLSTQLTIYYNNIIIIFIPYYLIF
jgi:hypothetical protein